MGTYRHEEHHQHQYSVDVSAYENVSDRLRDALGSWFGGMGPCHGPSLSMHKNAGKVRNLNIISYTTHD